MDRQFELEYSRFYSESFKKMVVQEYLAGGVSQGELLRKYKIGGKSSIPKWMKRFGYTEADRSQEANFTGLISPDLAKKQEQLSNSDLLKRIKDLERQLEDEKIRSEAYARIIDKAEKELKIPIRKKPNTK